jgi:periplasmic protein TonB
MPAAVSFANGAALNEVATDRALRLAVVVVVHGGLAALLFGGGHTAGLAPQSSIHMTLASAPPSPRPRPAPKPSAPQPLSPAAAATAAATPVADTAPASEPQWAAGSADNPWPVYPVASRRLREEGEVRLRVHVSGDGRAAEIQIVQSSGFPRLDQAARSAVLRWRFVPARRGADTIDAWVLVPIAFTIEN